MAEGYITPQVRVFQLLTRVPALTERRLPAHIAGGHAWLVRYAEADEQALGLLGYYDAYADQEFAWPNLPAGAVVDPDYTKLFMRNALLQYFASGTGITKVAGYHNRIRAADISFVENTDDFPRDADLYDRDVTVGDIVKVRGINAEAETVTLWTYVKQILPDQVAAVVSSATNDDNNTYDNSSPGATVEKIAGVGNCVNLTANSSSYDGLPSGFVGETYDVIVVESSIGNDLSTARLRIVSGSGTDDQSDVPGPADFDQGFLIGTRGLIGTFTDLDTVGCSESASDEEVSTNDLIAGQRWRITIVSDWEPQGVSAEVIVNSDNFTGTESTTYTLEVTKGGVWAASPQVTVTTSTGTDASGPTTVEDNVPFSVGTKGLFVTLAGSAGLRKGDKWHIEVTGTSDGAYKTLVLGHSLDTTIADDAALDLTLYILKTDLEITPNRTGFAPLVNWEQTGDLLTVKSGIVAYDATWTDGGVQLPLDVVVEDAESFGRLYVQYRAWQPTWALKLDSVTLDDLDSKISGPIHPDNPLKYGCFKALTNSNGTPVRFSAVGDPSDVESWAAMLEILVGRDNVYGLVPLTRNQTVLELYEAHIAAMSNENNNLWREGWFSLSGLANIPVVHAGSDVPGYIEATTEDDELAMCVIEDDPSTSGTQYTRVRCTSDNANFITNGVRAGDTVRAQYTTDGFGNTLYSSYTVDEVLSENELNLVSGPSAPVSVAAKTEIWRTQTATEEATSIGMVAGAWASRRIMAVWPDTIEASGVIVEGYHLCAALAGLASGVLPQQGLTHVEISGFTATPRSLGKFNKSQLDIMSAAGAWVVEQDLTGLTTSLGQIYTRHAITTYGYTDQTQREEMITRNVDSISYRFREWFKPYIGRVNVTPGTKARLQIEADSLIEVLKTESATADLGGQLLTGTTVTVEAHPLARDRFIVDLDAVVPYALNNIDVKIVF